MEDTHREEGDAVTLLGRQHNEVRSLFQKIEREGIDEARFDRLLTALAVHMEIEENVFYPSLLTGGIDEEEMRKAAEEHLSAKRILADLIDLSPEDETWTAKLEVLKEQFEHHASEEEEKVFPWAQENLDPEYLKALKEEMTTSSAEMSEDEEALRERVVNETAEAASLEPLG